MNDQSMGALLILGGMAMLWAVWSERSPFRRAMWGEAAPAKAGEPAADLQAGFWKGFWGSIPGAGLIPGTGANPATP